MYNYRKLHRSFGLIIGIQFLFWTLGGIFFAWSNLDQIHGDFERKSEPVFENMIGWQSPEKIYSTLIMQKQVDSIASLNVVQILDVPHYQIKYFTKGESAIALANTLTAELRPPLSKEEAVKIAKSRFRPKAKIKNIELLTDNNMNKHHEYRKQPLPAYAITFDHKSGTTVYVGTELGQVLKLRNSNWRIFDFLWMMHTMDYLGRDNFGNILLRIFSVLGLITIISGFILYFQTTRRRNLIVNN